MSIYPSYLSSQFKSPHKIQITKTQKNMRIGVQHLLLQLFLATTFHHLSHSANTTSSNPTFYYNQCAPSTCGGSILKYPFGNNTLCSSAYITTTCENNSVFLTDDENTYIKYQLLQNLTDQVYSNTSVRLVDTALYGCGTIPSFQGLTPNSGYEAQKWVMLGALHYTADYRTGTFFNCTREPSSENLARMMKAPCLECGDTTNVCYFYDGYIDHVSDCSAFRVAIPVKQFGNFSGVGNLRRILQEGFAVEWNTDCSSCMRNDVGRCGYLNQDRKAGEEYCFCRDGVHSNNCTDGVLINLNTTTTNNQLRQSSKSHTGLIVGIAIGGAILCLCASCLFYRRRHKVKQVHFKGKRSQALKRYLDGEKGSAPASIETFLENYTLGRPTKFSYKQLRRYTNNFNHKIGQGGFGSVFKGQLPNGFTIAVKILDETTNQIETQFLNEVLTIGRIHHNHLVRLLGYCFDDARIALIYEFMVNGSLDKYIHEKKHKIGSPEQGVTEKLSLNWSQLQDIAIGTAKGLAYLHEECRSRILHCDIKPHNILLDENFQPKVSDFGLAMALNKDNSHISVTHGTGTPGYAPPEMWYVKFGPITDKSDVYSFGMVVLEMAGKRRNFDVDVSKSSEVYFPQWVFSHHVQKAYGDGGGSKWHECEGQEEEEMAMRMELVGLWCIQFEPSKRPSMRKVVDMLEGNVAIEIPPAPFDANTSPFGPESGGRIATELNTLDFYKKAENVTDE